MLKGAPLKEDDQRMEQNFGSLFGKQLVALSKGFEILDVKKCQHADQDFRRQERTGGDLHWDQIMTFPQHVSSVSEKLGSIWYA